MQVLGDAAGDVPIPGEDYGFAALEQAQADGDLLTLHERQRRAGRARLDELLEVSRRVGMVGLGKMGGNMASRIRDAGHEVVGTTCPATPPRWRRSPSWPSGLTRHVVWVMVPSGDPTEGVVTELAGLLQPGDVVIDGGNSNWHDSVRRQARTWRGAASASSTPAPAAVWGCTEGYCLMVGGSPEHVETAQPIFRRAEAGRRGFVHAGAVGTGHFTKMVHNGIEYGIMEAYAEGYELLDRSGLDIDVLGALDAWRGAGSVVRSWLLDLVQGAAADAGPQGHRRRRRGPRRGPLDSRRRSSAAWPPPSSARRCSPGSCRSRTTRSP